MARISAIEATADGVNWNYSPMVDICRDPRWGRIAEGSGEDPYLGSVLAQAYVHGYQGDGMRSDSSLMACVKHYALYGAAEGGRDYNGDMEVCVTNYGGRIVSLMVPDKDGRPRDVVLGHDNIRDYLEIDGNFGAIIGRYGNRID